MREIILLSSCHVFEKFLFHNVLRSHENEKPAFSYASGLKSVFENAPFSSRDGLVRTVGLNCRNKAVFSNSSGVE